MRTYLTFRTLADFLALDWTPLVAASPDASKASLRAIPVSFTIFTYYEKNNLTLDVRRLWTPLVAASRRRLARRGKASLRASWVSFHQNYIL